MVRRQNPARLVLALGIAAVLAVFLLYTSIAGGGTPSLRPSQLKGRTGEVALAGKVVGKVRRDRDRRVVRFTLRDVEGTATVPVVYRDSVPALFRRGRDVLVRGTLRDGVFVGKPGTMITKCPSKYTPKRG